MYQCKDKVIIAIGRTFGSGAREIGKKVAEELAIPFYDKELLKIAARESGGVFFPEELDVYDEKRIRGFLYSMAFNSHTGNAVSWDMAAQNAQTQALYSVAEKGSCVIVGRRADKILREKYNVLSVFISAPMEKRIARVSHRDALSRKDSEKKILKADKARRSYYNAYEEGDWGEASNYNLCIDSGELGIDNSAALIIRYLILRGLLN